MGVQSRDSQPAQDPLPPADSQIAGPGASGGGGDAPVPVDGSAPRGDAPSPLGSTTGTAASPPNPLPGGAQPVGQQSLVHSLPTAAATASFVVARPDATQAAVEGSAPPSKRSKTAVAYPLVAVPPSQWMPSSGPGGEASLSPSLALAEATSAVVAAGHANDSAQLTLALQSSDLRHLQRGGGSRRLEYVAKWTSLRFPPKSDGYSESRVDQHSALVDDLHVLDDAAQGVPHTRHHDLDAEEEGLSILADSGVAHCSGVGQYIQSTTGAAAASTTSTGTYAPDVAAASSSASGDVLPSGLPVSSAAGGTAQAVAPELLQADAGCTFTDNAIYRRLPQSADGSGSAAALSSGHGSGVVAWPSPSKKCQSSDSRKRRKLKEVNEAALVLTTACARATSAPSLQYGALLDGWGQAQAYVDLWSSPFSMVVPGKDTKNDTCRTWVCRSALHAWQQLRSEGTLEPKDQPFHTWLASQRSASGGTVCCAIAQVKRLPDYSTFCRGANVSRDAFSKAFYSGAHKRRDPPQQPPDLRTDSNRHCQMWYA